MTPSQLAAQIISVSKNLDAIGEALEAARASLAVMSMEYEAILNPTIEEEPVRIGSEDSDVCQHPDCENIMGQYLCNDCGMNVSDKDHG